MFRLWSIILAGEAIFVLPFMLPRLFRPLLLRQWGVSNTQLGAAMSVYGFVAVVAYFAGGPIADRFSPRRLMAIALVSTAACGGLLLGTPSPTTLAIAYAGFGITTILLFWSAMIRQTHMIGGRDRRGFAFGILDGGRGLFAAVLSTAMIYLLGDNVDSIRPVVLVAIAVVLIAAAAVWFVAPEPMIALEKKRSHFRLDQCLMTVRNGQVWMQGIVLLCAYIGYKSVDNFGIYAVDVYGYTDRQSATLTSIAFWMRPPAALIAGWMADRVNPFLIMSALFAAMAVSTAPLMIGADGSLAMMTVVASMTIAAAAVYAMRAVYFAVIDELSVPPIAVGTAAGLISTVGFLPDIFFAVLTGYWIDRSPGGPGYATVFMFVTGAALIGMAVSVCQWMKWFNRGGDRRT